MGFFWEKQDWEAEDQHLCALAQAPFRRRFPTVRIGKGLQSIRGPRQIGKSSWLKTLLSEEVRQGKKCFFMSCEELHDDRELSEVLRTVKNRDVLFLDEISFVSQWDRSIKYLLDNGFRGSLLITGSNMFDLRAGIDRMPGRWAKGGGEYYLWPMDFSEWMQVRQEAGWSVSTDRVENLHLYFRVGGFPTSVIEAGAEAKKPVDAMQNYQRWIAGDLRRKGRQEVYARELMGQLALTLQSSISLQKLAQKTQMMSYHTAQEYITLLEDCFALRTLYCMDPNTGALRFKKEKKFYFTDPLIYHLSMEWAGHAFPDHWEEKMAEQVAHEHLARTEKRLGYFSSPKGEVDFFSPRQWAVEVKWSPTPKNISRAYFDLLVPKKKVWSQLNFLEPLNEGA